MSCPAIDPKEAEVLHGKVKSWLDSHKEGVVLKITSDSDGFQPIETFHNNHPTKKLMFYFSDSGDATHFSIGFESEVQDDWTTETAKKQFRHVALDKLPLPGLEKPSNWNIRPQTPVSSFKEGFELELFDVKNKRIKFRVKTNAFCIHGSRNDLPKIGCGEARKGSYFDVEQSVPLDLTVDLPITIG